VASWAEKLTGGDGVGCTSLSGDAAEIWPMKCKRLAS
jgi:hypothetical protein